MTKFNKRVVPKGWMYPLNKKEIKSLIMQTGSVFDNVEFENTTKPSTFRQEEIDCWFGVLTSKRINGEYIFSLKLDSLKEEYVSSWKDQIFKLVGAEILEFVKGKLSQPSNSSEKPTQLFLKYNIVKGSITSKCFGVD